ncbi:MAG: M14 family metallopeptidase [Alphaproteobacteria bacterium]
MTDTFSRTYAEARGKFLDAAKGAGAALTTYAHPGQGPDGGALATDVARLGESNAPNLFIATSATHGVEGFCGSGCMVGFLEKRLHAELPRGTAMVLVHAINPHGFAHERRVNEDNVDLNRNFVDHAAPRAPNAAYDAIHAMQVPEDWDGPARAEADRHIAAYIAAHGMKTYQAAVTGGQYTHPDGLFYGGRAPVWSHRTWREIIKTHVAPVRRVAYVDFHTGLGPRGYGEPISREAPDSPVFHRARAWYGAEVTSTRGGTSTSAVVEGDTSRAFESGPHAPEVTTVALEFGTRPVEDVLGALRADNWLYLRGKVDSPLGRTIKRQIRDAFYGEDDPWKRSVLERGFDIARKAFRGVSQS